MSLTAKELEAELAQLSGLPRYKVGAMLVHLANVIKFEAARGAVVALPSLGVFGSQVVKAKTVKNTIAQLSRGPDGKLVTKTAQLPERKRLVFTAKDAEKWL